jgi:hypothetical protein
VFPARLKEKSMTGPLRHPRRRLSPAFRAHVREVMRDRMRGTTLAIVAGLPSLTALSELLHREFPATDLNLERARRLATLVAYNGEIFESEAAR